MAAEKPLRPLENLKTSEKPLSLLENLKVCRKTLRFFPRTLKNPYFLECTKNRIMWGIAEYEKLIMCQSLKHVFTAKCERNYEQPHFPK